MEVGNPARVRRVRSGTGPDDPALLAAMAAAALSLAPAPGAEETDSLTALTAILPLRIWAVDGDGIFTRHHGNAGRLPMGEMVGRSLALYGPEVEAAVWAAVEAGTPTTFISEGQVGGRPWVYSTLVLPLPGGAGAGAVAVSMDLTPPTFTDALLSADSRLHILAEYAPVGVLAWDHRGHLLFANSGALDLVGETWEAVEARAWLDFVHPEDRELVLSFSPDRPWENGPNSCDLRLVRSDGATRWARSTTIAVLGEDDAVEACLSTLTDITDSVEAAEARGRSEQELAYLATHDPVTDLANRPSFHLRLDEALARSAPAGGLLVNVDRLAFLSGTLGLRVGDELFRQAAHRISAIAGPHPALVARYSEQLAAVLLEPLRSESAPVALAVALTEAFTEPFVVDGELVHMSVSIGIALTPDTGGPGVTGEGLVADAGMAMSVARKAGGGRHHLFDPAMRDTVVTRQRVEGGIRRALDEREFVVHYQPVVSLVDGLVCGLEALVRWEHPEEGLLPPGAFIAVAEDRGLILPLGAWVLEEACAVLAGLDVGPTFEMAVNLSARQLLDQDVVSLVSGVLDRTGARPDQLALELTETALIREPTSARPALEALRELGVRISLDDFGTGFSSLTHLSEFPIDIVRIDRRFVNALPGPGTDASVVEAIIGLSCTLGLDLIAEGVETAAQAAALVSMECEKAQGFLFAHPAPLSKIGPLLLGRSLLPGPA